MRNKIHTLLMTAVALLAVSCEADYKLYDTTQKDSVFFDYENDSQTADSVITYSFDYDIANEHVINIPISLMGIPKTAARTINLQVVADSTDMVENVNFTIERAQLAANAISDTVKIKLLRDKDPEILTKEKKLRIKIVESDDLRPTGQDFFTVKYSDIRPDRPKWWGTFNPLPVYTYENAQLFFKYFYELAPKADKSVYDELISKYGEYFINAKDMEQGGPMAFYSDFLCKYVLIPMYNDTKDTMEWQMVPSVN